MLRRGLWVGVGLVLLSCSHEHRPEPTPEDDTTGPAADSGEIAADAQPPDTVSRDAALDAAPLPEAAAHVDADASPVAEDTDPRPRCDYEIELRAHGGQTLDDNTPFTAPSGGDHYELFWFAPTWSSKVQLVEVEPLADNAIIRDWLLYTEAFGTRRAGSHEPSLGLPRAGAVLLTAWSHGAGSMPIASDVGIRIVHGTTAGLGLEIHYFATPTTASREDRSGVRLCLTEELRPKEATVHQLGTSAIVSDGTSGGLVRASGECTPKQGSHLLAYAPRMRRQGRRIQISTRRNGLDSVLIDRPFDLASAGFEALPSEVSVQPGDVLTTTCTYQGDRPFMFGPTEDDELCAAFVLAWPAGSLSNGSTDFFAASNCVDGI